MTKDAQAIILEAQALETIGDHDAFDAWVSSLSDDEFVLYQRWQRDREYLKRLETTAKAIGEALQAAFRDLAVKLRESIPEFERFHNETMERARELLERLADYAEVSRDAYRKESQSINELARISRYVTFRKLDDSHYAITKMKPLKQYAARR
jgi:hypothetical protein